MNFLQSQKIMEKLPQFSETAGLCPKNKAELYIYVFFFLYVLCQCEIHWTYSDFHLLQLLCLEIYLAKVCKV